MEEESKKKSNVFVNTIIIIILIVVCVFIYAKYGGTRGIRVHEYRISNDKIPMNFSGIKVIYFSDFLYAGSDEEEMIKESVDNINLLKPDIVLFGGGLISKGYKLNDKERENIIKHLSKIDARLGKYAVMGSNDDSVVLNILNSSNFMYLDNKEENVYLDDNIPICLVGIGSYVKGSYDLVSSFEFKNTNPSCYTVMFTHEADIIDKVKELANKPNLILAGNSLGGEINIPFYGGLFRNEGNMNYFLDNYVIGDMDIYISSGFGTSERGVRFNNKPSFNFFRLKSLH